MCDGKRTCASCGCGADVAAQDELNAIIRSARERARLRRFAANSTMHKKRI